MSKKYLSIEEAAQMLGMETSELNRLREKSEIRAFADRGTWKFKLEDVENLGRSRQADSDPEFPIHDTASAGDVLSEDDEDALSEQPTIIRRPSADDANSDSDVRLIFDDSMGVTDEGSDDDIGITLSDSDSDVQLTSESRVRKGSGSDSDVRLVGSDSDVDVKLVGQGSDSDVQLIGTSGSDSDVAIVPDRKSGGEKKGPKSEKNLGNEKDFDLPIDLSDDDDDSFSLAPLEGDRADQTINLSPVSESESVLDDDADSGISLAGDSGLSLASASGISLERPNDSGISLSDDSALQLSGDSGITLADDNGSSGISLASPSSKLGGKKPSSSVKGGKAPGKAGKKKLPESSDDLHATMPMMESPLLDLDDDDSHDTQMEVPLFDDDNNDSDMDISADLGGSSTSVITLDDEDDVDGHSPTMVKKKRSSGEDSEDLLEDGMFDDGGTAEIDEVEVSDDIIGEDDELEDVFGAEDEDFDASMETGESHAELPISAPARGMAAPVEYDWGVPSFVGLALSTVLMVVCGTVMFDLVRNMWHTDTQHLTPVSSTMLDLLRDTFKG